MKKKIKVLYITRKYPPIVGGMENFSWNLYSEFSKHDDVDITLIALRKSQRNLIWFFPLAFLKTIFTAKKYDVIFIGDAVLCAIGFFCKCLYKTKIVIINVFGLDITYKNKLYQLYLKLFYKNFDKYVSISRETDNILQKRGCFDSTIITPGVDVNMIAYEGTNWREICERYDIEQNNIIIITVGRLVKRKGVEWFVKNVMPRLRDKQIEYLIVGSGEDEEDIKKSILEHGLDKKIKMLGEINFEDLLSIYRNADIFVMPNIIVDGDFEGFGIVALEASLSGCVTVASNIQGIKDAIVDGENGILLETENSEQFINTISELIDNIELRKKYSERFKKYTISYFSWGSICNQYISLFNSFWER